MWLKTALLARVRLLLFCVVVHFQQQVLGRNRKWVLQIARGSLEDDFEKSPSTIRGLGVEQVLSQFSREASQSSAEERQRQGSVRG